MGEIADAMLDGDMCEQCGELLGDGDGFPRLCRSCQPTKTNRRQAIHARPLSVAPDTAARARRWLEAASSSYGVNPDAAPSYLPKLAKRGLVKLVDDIGDRAYFITDAGRKELQRIARKP